MADVVKAWDFVLSNEDAAAWLFVNGQGPASAAGKVVSEPTGGMARLGINSIAHPEVVARGFYAMPLDQALEFALDIFKFDYWARVLGYNIESQLLATKLSDLSFNGSAREAVLLLQRAINVLRPAGPLTDDGVMGPNTLARLNTFLDALDEETLYAGLLAQGTAYYSEIQAENPEKYSPELLAAWLHRLNKRPYT